MRGDYAMNNLGGAFRKESMRQLTTIEKIELAERESREIDALQVDYRKHYLRRHFKVKRTPTPKNDEN